MSAPSFGYVCMSCRRVALQRPASRVIRQQQCRLVSHRIEHGCASTRQQESQRDCQRRCKRLYSHQTTSLNRTDGSIETQNDHNGQSQSLLTPIQLLQQFQDEAASQQGTTEKVNAYGTGPRDLLESIGRDLSCGRQLDAWTNLLRYADRQQSTGRQQLQAHRLFQGHMSKLVEWFISSSFTEQNIQLSGSTNAGAATENVLANNASPFEPKEIYTMGRLLRRHGLLTPRLQIQSLYDTLHHSISLLSSEVPEALRPSATEYCTRQVLCLWNDILLEQHKTEIPDLSVRTTIDEASALEWSFLPTFENLQRTLHHDSSLGDYLGQLLVLRDQDARSLSDMEMVAFLTLYFAKHITQWRGGSVEGSDQSPNSDTAASPLFSLLQTIYDEVRPESVPVAIRLRASRNYGNKPNVYAKVIQHFGFQQIFTPTANTPTEAGAQPSSLTSDNSGFVAGAFPFNTDAVVPDHIRQQVSDIKKRAARAAERRDAKLADAVFRSVVEYEQQATDDTRLPPEVYEHLIRMFLDLSFPKQMLQVLELMKKYELPANNKILTTLMRRANKLGVKPPIDLLWKTMLESGVQPDGHAWSARIFALVNANQPEEVMKALDELRSNTVLQQQTEPQPTWKPDITVVNAALTGFANHRVFQPYIPQALAWAASMGLKPDITTYNTLINIAMRESADKAFRLLERMWERGVTPNDETATVIVTALFHTDVLDGKTDQEMTEYLVNFLDDVEGRQVGVPMNAKGYTTALTNVLLVKQNLGAGQALLERMQANNITLTAQHYTILMDFYLTTKPPLYQAFESLWNVLQIANGGYGVAVDEVFCDRALERMADHHRVLGVEKVEQVLSRIIEQRLRPSWTALQGLARIYHERGDRSRLARLIDDIRSSKGIFAHGASKPFGQNDFWAYIVSLGIMVDQGFTRADQLMIRDSQWRRRRSHRR